ncbi:hypothetical protein Tco_0972672 [Tanacetum coccineum]
MKSGPPRLLCLVVGGIVVQIVTGNYRVVVEKSGYISFVVEVAIVDSKNLLDRVSSCTSLLDQNRCPVDISLIHIKSRKSPTAVLFYVDTDRISIRHCETEEYHSECSGKITKIMLQNVGHLVGHNAIQNQGIQNVGNQNGLSVIPGIVNQYGNGYYASNCIVKPRKRDAVYLQTQLQIAQKEEAGIQLNFEEFDFMAAVGAYDKIEEVDANCTLKDNLQQASTSGTQTDSTLVYDSDGSAEVHHSKKCYDNDIFNMFTQEEKYTKLLEPIPEPHQVQQNDINVIFEVSSVEQGGGTVEQHPATIEETHAYFESLYNNLAIKVEKVNTVNRKSTYEYAWWWMEMARSSKLALVGSSQEYAYNKMNVRSIMIMVF